MRPGFWRLVFRFIAREDGQDLIEYALILSLIAAAMVAGITQISGAINILFTNLSNNFGAI